MAVAISQMGENLAHRLPVDKEIVLLGIQRGGVYLAERLHQGLSKRCPTKILLGQLDVSMYRDDLDKRAAPPVYPTIIPGDINDKTVILVDDVLFRGRTVRAALDALHDLGRPQVVHLAVLIDRGHRQLPIQAEVIGKKIDTNLKDQVQVRFKEDDGEDVVLLESP